MKLRTQEPRTPGGTRLLVGIQRRLARANSVLLVWMIGRAAFGQVRPEDVVLDEGAPGRQGITPGMSMDSGVAPRLGKTWEPGQSPVTLVVKAESAAYVDSDAVSVLSPSLALRLRNETAGWDIGGTYLVDAVSAASVDIVSTASGKWDEIRHVGSVDASLKEDIFTVGAAGSASVEPDYLSLTAGLSLSAELDQKHITPRFGYTYTDDTAGLTDTPYDEYSFSITRHGISLGSEFVVNAFTTFTLLGDWILDSGDQRKPYRWVPAFSPEVAATIENGTTIEQVNELRLPGRMTEAVPLTRQRVALTGRLAQRYSGSTLVLKERFYSDSWGTRASTTTLRFVVDGGNRFYFWPEVRVHTQGGASFYKIAYAVVQGPGQQTVPEFRTGDRELGPLLTGTGGFGFRWFIGSDAHPSATALVLETEFGQTNYHEALFVTRRRSAFVALQLESEF